MAVTRRLKAAPKRLAILGSTGSIGTSTLEVVRKFPERFRVVTLAAGNNVALVERQIEEFRPLFVSMLTKEAASEVKRLFPRLEVSYGSAGAIEAAAYEGVDTAVSAISGAAGLLPTLSAIEAGVDVALANKESLVLAGPLVMDRVRRKGVRLIPVDSEHSAVFQAVCGHRREDLKRIILTASGGPFLSTPLKDLPRVTPKEALRHPRWKMGRKITIDSATLVNKGLEVIEARWLFGMEPGGISVVMHPQSIVHSMVEYIDGSIVAQMSVPDMKGPIAYALTYPERVGPVTKPLDMRTLRLDFMEPDERRFPCLSLAFEALEAGGVMPGVLNAADEAAVDAFLKGRIRFTDIYRVIAGVLDMRAALKSPAVPSIEEILEADSWAREKALGLIKNLTKRPGR